MYGRNNIVLALATSGNVPQIKNDPKYVTSHKVAGARAVLLLS